jgi:hypothetical protein
MKKLAVLTLFAMPALAHEVPFDDKRFLNLTKGDTKAAQELSWFCETQSTPLGDCAKNLQGDGNLKQEAARKCLNESILTLPRLYLSVGSTEVPGSRAHKAEGTRWHTNYVKSPESGRLHRHAYSDEQREEAYQAKLTMLLIAARNRMDTVNGASTIQTGVHSESGSSVSAGVGIKGAFDALVNAAVDFVNGKSTSLEKGQPLPDKEIELAKKGAEEARLDPSKVGIEPEILCYVDERNCTVGSSDKTISNDSYDPNYKESNNSKDSSNTKQSEDTKDTSKKAKDSHDDHDHESDIDQPKDKSNDENSGDSDTPKKSTPIIDDLTQKTALERCIEKETKLLIDEIGKKTINPDAATDSHTDNQIANSLLQHGYCDEQVMGVEFCRVKRFKENSVVAVTIREERKEAAAQALESFRQTGICDSNALGREFCKKERNKWEVTPKGFNDIKVDGKLVKPIKSGDLPNLPGLPIPTNEGL